VWMEVETCGNSWKVVKSVLIFIYTLVISISLASKLSMLRIELLARYRYLVSHCCLVGAVFALIFLKFSDYYSLYLFCVIVCFDSPWSTLYL